MFLQPTIIFPSMEPLQPLRNFAIITILFYIFSKTKSSKAFLSEPINRYFILFVGFQVLSGSQYSLRGGLEAINFWLKIGIVYYLIVKVVADQKRVRIILISMITGIGYLSYFSYSEYVMSYVPGDRVSGFGWFENPNDLAIILVMSIPLTLLIYNFSKKKATRLIYLFAACMFSGNILFTGSRGGMIGLAVTGLLSICTLKRIPKIYKTILGTLLCVGIIMFGIASILSRGGVGGLRGDESSEDRIIQWKAGMRMLFHNPILGIGPDEFVSQAQDYGGVHGLMPHNTFVQAFAENGIFGGIFFSLMIFKPLWLFFKSIRSKINQMDDDKKVYLRFIGISLLGYAICSFFSNRLRFHALYVIVALFIAIKDNLIGDQVQYDNQP
jgi:O-antigen ligase